MVDIPNYFDRAVALLASQFQTILPGGALTNFQKMLYAILTQAQLIQTQMNLLQTMRYLNTAQGVQLDGLGQILGLARVPGQSDASYREDLQFQIFINTSSGTPEQMIYILSYLTEASKVWYLESYPAGYVMTTNGLIFPTNPSDLVAAIQNVSPAGVQFEALIATYDTNPFVFSSDPFDEQLYVNPNPVDPAQYNPLQVYDGVNTDNFFVQIGQTSNPNFGGGFAEAILIAYPDYDYDNTGAGQLTESIQPNGNIPPPY
jgi:hypothetical protein